MDNKQKGYRFKLNAGSGMVLGIVIGAIIALIVNVTTGNSSVWIWAIPVGLAVGLAIGAAQGQENSKEK